jgi:hypothetical protein
MSGPLSRTLTVKRIGKTLLAKMELSYYYLDDFIAKFMDKFGLHKGANKHREVVGCSFGKMWIIYPTRNSYRVRICDKKARFSNLYLIGEFIYKHCWQEGYYENKVAPKAIRRS